jgi:hypothetical protein
MNKISVYNFLDGKNLCNIFANLIVNKIRTEVPDAKTEVSVINVRNFFIVKGKTSSNTLINIAELFQEFLNSYDEELSKKVRVFDTIEYETEPDSTPVNITFKKDKLSTIREKEIKKILDKEALKKVYISLKIEDDTKYVYYDCHNDMLSVVKTLLEKEFPKYKLIKSDFSQEVYVSDHIYGSTNHKDKLYYILLENVTKHLFDLGISTSVDFSLHTNLKISDLDNENIELQINNDNHIVKTSWLRSLILDIFPFSYDDLKSTFNDCNDLQTYLLDSECEVSLNRLFKISDFILI